MEKRRRGPDYPLLFPCLSGLVPDGGPLYAPFYSDIHVRGQVWMMTNLSKQKNASHDPQRIFRQGLALSGLV
jgi:hypothetical protein